MIKNLISVIIPVYNVEKYLSQCLLSLKQQTNKNFEVIFVNDGSTDNSEAILKNYCLNNKNARFFTQNNQGVSVAKNNGLKQALGEYVYFMDSDDFIHPQTLEVYLKTAIETGCDIVTSGFYFKKEETKYLNTHFKNIKKPKFKYYSDLDDYFARYLASKKKSYFFLGGHNKLYKRSILQKISGFPNLFEPTLSYGEDTNLVCKYLLLTKSLTCIHERFYYYRQRKGSILHSGFYEKLLTLLKCLEPINNLDEKQFKQTCLQRNELQCIYALEMLGRISNSTYNNIDVINNIYLIYKKNLKYGFLAKHTIWYHKIFLWCTWFYVKPIVIKKRRQNKH